MPCKPAPTANLQARPLLTPARSFRDDIVVVAIARTMMPVRTAILVRAVVPVV
jgi:hypothetical protein